MKSILAGIAIAIGAYINLKIGGVTGAVVFSVGLFLICHFQLDLYTGKVGYTGIIHNLPILLGNAVGVAILYFYPIDTAVQIVEKKLNTPLYISFINAVICGILIYAAVECFKHGKEYMVLICVPAFILFGAEHCVADMGYVASAGMMSWKILVFLAIIIVGNSIGSLMFRFFTKSVNWKE